MSLTEDQLQYSGGAGRWFWPKLRALPPFVRFLFTGILATLVHYVVLRMLLAAGLSMGPSNVLGFVTALMVTYIGNRYFVFEARRGHVSSFAGVAAGAVTGAFIHTSLMIGFTSGAVLSFLAGPAADFGGRGLIFFWQQVLTLVGEQLAGVMTGESLLELSTGFSFVIASGTVAVLTYCWNRFVVFKA